MNSSALLENQIRFDLPPDKNFLVWLSHDVDRVHKTFFHALYYAVKDRKAGHITSFFSQDDPYWNFKSIMALEDRYNVKSTFFFLNESMNASIFHPYSFILAKGRYAITDPAIQARIRELDGNGWEIGVHGSYRSFSDKALLEKEKSELEKIIGHPVKGIRQHYLNMNIPETWEIHQELGFQYDASFGLTKDISWRDDIYYPFRPFNNTFTVFPMTIMDSALFKKYKDTETIWQKCLEIIDKAQKKKTLLSLLWHQRVFNEHDFPGYTEIYERLIKECKRRDAQFCIGENIHQYISKE
ncbi:MAG: polysaccharide deacetylase family protein [Candidatus Omnitrophica bacterium]|nr:polysaccharide deacetylase family protein [Candidatus Omnitrophota bacterium]